MDKYVNCINNKSHPLVSVIIPTYNRFHFLKECIDSILSQSFKDIEVIIIDDGSTEDINEYLLSYREKITVIHQSNQGVSSARNHGIKVSKGEWISFCDSDDLWLPRKLDMQMEFFHSNPEAVLCYTDEIWIRNGQRVNPRKRHKKYSGWIFEKCLPLCIVSPSSVVIHRKFFEKIGLFDEDLPACEDYDLWLRGSLYFPFYFLDIPLIIKRGGHDDQLSKKYWGMDRFRIYSIAKCLQSEDLTPEQRESAIKEIQIKSDILVNGAIKRDSHSQAQLYRDLSLTLQPNSVIINVTKLPVR